MTSEMYRPSPGFYAPTTLEGIGKVLVKFLRFAAFHAKPCQLGASSKGASSCEESFGIETSIDSFVSFCIELI